MRIGVGVEGPSDRAFWEKVLHKYFSTIRFDVRSMNSKERLIRQTPQLLMTFRSLQYAAGFILVDRDKDPCVGAVLARFDDTIREQARRPVKERYLFVCVAIRGLEAWFLADPSALSELLPKASYVAPEDTATLSPKPILRKSWQEQFGWNAAANKTRVAQIMAPHFNPETAQRHSQSFAYFWTKMTAITQVP